MCVVLLCFSSICVVGLVYNYTLSGVRRDERGWERCVCVQLCPAWRQESRESWDRELEQFSALTQWASERYLQSCRAHNHMHCRESPAYTPGENCTGKKIQSWLNQLQLIFLFPQLLILSLYNKIVRKLKISPKK